MPVVYACRSFRHRFPRPLNAYALSCSSGGKITPARCKNIASEEKEKRREDVLSRRFDSGRMSGLGKAGGTRLGEGSVQVAQPEGQDQQHAEDNRISGDQPQQGEGGSPGEDERQNTEHNG